MPLTGYSSGIASGGNGMESTKRWYLSRAVWAGVLAVLIAAYNTAVTQFGLPPIPDFVYGILGALGIYGRTAATQRVGK